jgi:Domain of unknown function (DUF6457)
VSTLQRWTEAACAELGLDPAAVDERLILDLTRVVAHQVDRPAAPLTAFLAGLAAGRGEPLAAAVATLTALATAWPEPPDGAPAPRKDSGQGLAAPGEEEQVRQD